MQRFLDEREWGRELPLEFALERAAGLISERTGIVRAVQREPVVSDLPRLYEYVAPFASSRVISDGEAAADAGGGGSLRPAVGRMKAIGEALERYSLGIYRTAPMPLGSYESFRRSRSCLDPGSLSGRPGLSADEARTSVLRWTEGIRLPGRQPCLVPSQLVYVPYHPPPDETPLWGATSSGVAAGSSLSGAVLRAALELVEREAFLLAYLHGHRPQEFDLSSVTDPLFGPALDALDFCGLELKVLNLTTDLGIPVALAVISDRSGRFPALNLGAKAALSRTAAIVGAVEECLHLLAWGRSLLQLRSADVGPLREAPGPLSSLEDRLLFWSPVESLDAVEFFVHPAAPGGDLSNDVPWSDDTRSSCATVIDRLADHGVGVVALDLTPVDVAQAGFRVVRVLAPELVPLYLDERDKAWAGPRLFEVPRRLGWAEAKSRPEDLVATPHPFL